MKWGSLYYLYSPNVPKILENKTKNHFIGIYCRLYCYAQKHVKSIRAITRPIDIPNSTSKKKSIKHQKNKALHIHLHNHQSSPYHVSDHKAAVTVGIIMGVFLICWVTP